ncbi:hypothetical protein SEVIR_3G029900v4 [Setaria viridis]|uniref:DUF761 domain-containing protein n=1 Tax=Setaria viridis TaxID=4556 RepID=A0A4U6V4T9_SETVI|nr:uncharacterized protein LOC117848074 [Setaria viridis]TKW24088.1 hypothetical protein SEVIR_3G029900v2 [Setaria viridis]
MEALLPSSISPKISTILQSHVYPRVGRVLRALARFKSLVLDAVGKTKRDARRKQQQHAIGCRSRSSSRKGSKQLVTSGFIMKPPLAWSGRLSPARAEALDSNYHVYPSLESAWNAAVPVPAPAGEDDGMAAAEYCGYLRWLEEEMPDVEVLVVEEEEEEDVVGAGGGNEIDRLAEKFIARCRARFLLEKQESYDRRCQEMIARSM